ncbi:A disintegrin and metalloproteinase with thrombospondin motifs like [Microplitis mediator]|uniref:A disintegrin and metalloproteinase with thrombospondin motifs like n=1 Tax=Microplitis mediator TaxID=375433 RepID=UPI002553F02E|nr:A disintegrin and metalloproteinase with thrombospondin motifs like [Microplitis mediator]
MTEVIFLCAVLGVLLQGVHLSEAEINNVKAKHVTARFGDDIMSWLTLDEGVLATENTPVYGLVEEPKVSVNQPGYQIIEHKDAMKNIIAYWRKNKPDAFTTPSNNKAPKANQEQSTVVKNKIPGEPARPKNVTEINEEISQMLKMNHWKSNIKCQIIRTTSKPYPSIVYPEIFVIVDNALFKKLGSNVRDVVTHVLAYWNGVDMLFRNLESPKFRFNIKAILIVEVPTSFPKLEYIPERIHPDQVILILGRWLYRYQRAFPIDSYDIAVLMTSNMLYASETRWRYTGKSYLGGACKTLHELELVAKTISVGETHLFLTIPYMAHQLGYSLGAFNYELDEECPWQYETEWSQCNLDGLTQSFATDNLSCLYNEIQEQGTAIPRLLPGKLFEPKKNCDDLQSNTTFIKYEDNCTKFNCWHQPRSDGSQSGVEYNHGLFDGTSCGQGKICLLGKCVQENLMN